MREPKGSGHFNRTVRQEWLGQYIWNTIEEIKDHATRRLWTCNNERPNMGIGGITLLCNRNTPHEF
jgi:hypothetical protein